jgi:hypothetical protein
MTQVDVSRLFVNLGSINCGIAGRKSPLDISCSMNQYVATCAMYYFSHSHHVENMGISSILFPMLDDLSLTLDLNLCVCLSTPRLVHQTPLQA